MTDCIFFDTDCICAFLWVKNESLLEKMYRGKIVIPKEVYDELDRPVVQHLKTRADRLIANGSAVIMTMDIMSDEYALYRKLLSPSKNCKAIGRGEAASISLAQKHNGILGSNNLQDIREYVRRFSLKHVTTGDLLVEAYKAQLITEQEGNTIWQAMLKKKRKIGAGSFTEFLNTRR